VEPYEAINLLVLIIAVLTGISMGVCTGVLSIASGTSRPSAAAVAAGTFFTSVTVIAVVLAFVPV
jgi:hypothetical protein